jgi:hypothetical protein
MITLCARHARERTTATLTPTGHPRSPAAPTRTSIRENSLAHFWHSFLIFAAFRASGGGRLAGVLASWLVTGILPVVAGRVLVSAGCASGADTRSPASAGPGLRTSLTWANATRFTYRPEQTG